MSAVTGAGTVVERIRIRNLGGTAAAEPRTTYEVVATDHLGSRECAGFDHVGVVGEVLGNISGATESGMEIVDAAIEDRDADARSVDPVGLDCAGSDVRDRLVEIEYVVTDGRNAGDRGVAGDVGKRRRIDLDKHRVQDLAYAGEDSRSLPLRHPDKLVLLPSYVAQVTVRVVGVGLSQRWRR